MGLRTGARLADGLADELVDGLADGLAEGLADELADGLTDELAEGLADGLAEGLADGLADGLGEFSADSPEQPTLPNARRPDRRSRVPVLVEGFHMMNSFVQREEIA